MAKKYIIYAGGKDLATIPVTQNEVGVYYWNGSTYHKPVLSQFDNATLPSGFKRYTNGSHTIYISNPLRNPIDFSLVAGTPITANFDVNVLSSTYSDGSWCKARIVGTDIDPSFVHTYQWASGLVKAGNVICKVAPQSVTGFAPHLHIDIWGSYLIRDLILTGNVKMSDQLKIGDKVQIVGGDMFLRRGAGTGFTSSVRTIKEGAVVQIKDGIRTSQNSLFYGKGSTIKENDSYLWIDVQDLAGQSGWIAITNRVQKVHGNTNLTFFDGTTPSELPPVVTPPPEAPVVLPSEEECKIYITPLENEIKALRVDLVASKKEVQSKTDLLKVAEDRVKHLEGVLEGEREEMNKLQKKFEVSETEKSRVENERNEWELKYGELKLKYEEGQDNFIQKILEAIKEWLMKVRNTNK